MQDSGWNEVGKTKVVIKWARTRMEWGGKDKEWDYVSKTRGWMKSARLWRACNLTSFSPFLTGPVDYLFASRHKGPRFKSSAGYLCETGILLLALSRYKT